MLAKHRRRGFNLWWSPAEIDCAPDQLHFAHPRMLDLHRESILAHLRVLKNFVERVQRRAGNVFLPQAADPIVSFALAENFL